MKKSTKNIFKKAKNTTAEAMSVGVKGNTAYKLMGKVNKDVAVKTATGPLIDTAIGTAEAGVATYQSRQKEKDYEKSGGIKGFSRTRANKKIASEWSGAAAGTAGGVGSAAALTTIAGSAMVGQVNKLTDIYIMFI